MKSLKNYKRIISLILSISIASSVLTPSFAQAGFFETAPIIRSITPYVKNLYKSCADFLGSIGKKNLPMSVIKMPAPIIIPAPVKIESVMPDKSKVAKLAGKAIAILSTLGGGLWTFGKFGAKGLFGLGKFCIYNPLKYLCSTSFGIASGGLKFAGNTFLLSGLSAAMVLSVFYSGYLFVLRPGAKFLNNKYNPEKKDNLENKKLKEGENGFIGPKRPGIKGAFARLKNNFWACINFIKPNFGDFTRDLSGTFDGLKNEIIEEKGSDLLTQVNNKLEEGINNLSGGQYEKEKKLVKAEEKFVKKVRARGFSINVKREKIIVDECKKDSNKNVLPVVSQANSNPSEEVIEIVEKKSSNNEKEVGLEFPERDGIYSIRSKEDYIRSEIEDLSKAPFNKNNDDKIEDEGEVEKKEVKITFYDNLKKTVSLLAKGVNGGKDFSCNVACDVLDNVNTNLKKYENTIEDNKVEKDKLFVSEFLDNLLEEVVEQNGGKKGDLRRAQGNKGPGDVVHSANEIVNHVMVGLPNAVMVGLPNAVVKRVEKFVPKTMKDLLKAVFIEDKEPFRAYCTGIWGDEKFSESYYEHLLAATKKSAKELGISDKKFRKLQNERERLGEELDREESSLDLNDKNQSFLSSLKKLSYKSFLLAGRRAAIIVPTVACSLIDDGAKKVWANRVNILKVGGIAGGASVGVIAFITACVWQPILSISVPIVLCISLKDSKEVKMLKKEGYKAIKSILVETKDVVNDVLSDEEEDFFTGGKYEKIGTIEYFKRMKDGACKFVKDCKDGVLDKGNMVLESCGKVLVDAKDVTVGFAKIPGKCWDNIKDQKPFDIFVDDKDQGSKKQELEDAKFIKIVKEEVDDLRQDSIRSESEIEKYGREKIKILNELNKSRKKEKDSNIIGDTMASIGVFAKISKQCWDGLKEQKLSDFFVDSKNQESVKVEDSGDSLEYCCNDYQDSPYNEGIYGNEEKQERVHFEVLN